LKMKDRTPTLFAIAIIHWRVGDNAAARQIAKMLIAAPKTSPHLRSLAKQLDRRLDPTKKPVEPVTPAGETR